MYLVSTLSFEGKAKREKDIKEWFSLNGIEVFIEWQSLRKNGYVFSDCERWQIEKVDGRELRDIEYLEECMVML